MKNNELKHHGIKGQRWGVRRTEAQLRRVRGSNKTRTMTEEEYNAEKQNVINSGNAKKVKKWESQLSTSELRDAINRINLHEQLRSFDKSSLQNGYGKVKSALGVIGDMANITSSMLTLYGNVAKTNNTFNSNKKMPIIGGKKKKN